MKQRALDMVRILEFTSRSIVIKTYLVVVGVKYCPSGVGNCVCFLSAVFLCLVWMGKLMG